MRKLSLALLGTLALALPLATFAAPAAKSDAAPKELSIEEVATLSKDAKASIFDANSAETRDKFGVIPGAHLLPSSTKYKVGKELPKDRDAKLVFYCANPRCTASDAAAKRALAAGYHDVNILRAGIMGWKDAGQPTSTPQGG